MRRLISETDFAGLAKGAPPVDVCVYRAAGDIVAVPAQDSSDRTIQYRFSTSAVARDGHTIATKGWQLDNFLSNPVFLFAHDSSDLPVGRVTQIGPVGDELRGTVEYVSRDVYPFADTVFQMVKQRFLNATSVSWDPLEWKFSTDKNRPGGIDFLRSELLEISQVPVPAQATSLAIARAMGIDTGPLVEWAERLLDGGGSVVVPRTQLEELRRAAQMPSSRRRRIVAAPGAETETPPAPAVAAAPKRRMSRSLYTVSSLADLIQYLAYLQSSSAREEEYEGDDSQVPALLLDVLKDLGSILVTMTVEEVAELLPTVDDEEANVDPDEIMVQVATLIAKRAVAPTIVTPAGAPLARAGKMMSADNERCLRDAHAALQTCCDDLLAGIDQATGANPEDDADGGTGDAATDDDMARARRHRRARALALLHQHGIENSADTPA
jgi:hypothetical protein